jgi:hypothetical protein
VELGWEGDVDSHLGLRRQGAWHGGTGWCSVLTLAPRVIRCRRGSRQAAGGIPVGYAGERRTEIAGTCWIQTGGCATTTRSIGLVR